MGKKTKENQEVEYKKPRYLVSYGGWLKYSWSSCASRVNQNLGINWIGFRNQCLMRQVLIAYVSWRKIRVKELARKIRYSLKNLYLNLKPEALDPCKVSSAVEEVLRYLSS